VLLAHHPSVRHLLLALYGVLRTTVALAFAAFTIDRSNPHRRSREPVAFLTCAGAMLAIALIAPPARSTPSALLLAGDVVAVLGCVWLLASVLVLGRCFGVLPEARGLVLRGPYRFVRHPVYLGEIVALIGLVIAAPALWNVIVLTLFVAAQIGRTHLEERALSVAFPDYMQYAANTGRLLPRFQLTNDTAATGAALNAKRAG
jgi:protein-S-isoprenylcysteine O-methyltransferase Ste14